MTTRFSLGTRVLLVLEASKARLQHGRSLFWDVCTLEMFCVLQMHVIVISLLFVFFVTVLHIVGKVRG